MQSEFKQCPNGHYYQGDRCPYCRTTKNASINSDEAQKTSFFVDSCGNTSTISTDATAVGGTEVIDDMPHNRTVFGDDDTPDSGMGGRKVRYARKLVGWLVSYSFDELGVDYKLYEGRNIIGRDAECNITVNDPRMSAKHAVLLYRANKYSLTDSQSSHGTFVNDVDIELEPHYLKDGDIIRMGNTVFKFRTSL